MFIIIKIYLAIFGWLNLGNNKVYIGIAFIYYNKDMITINKLQTFIEKMDI